MNVSLTDLKNELESVEQRATQLRGVISGIEALGLVPGKSRKARLMTRGPSPSGARKSIFHPNETDVAVLDAMLSYSPSEETPKLQMDWISKTSGIEKADVQKSIKWLNSAGHIETQGRGRGTHYEVKVDSNDLQAVDPTTLGDNFRRSGGPTVREICRTVFNGIEPAQRVAPAKVTEIAQALFPESNLTRQSFGQVFTKMAAAGELMFDGDGRSRKYWRGMDQIEGAAEIPEGFDFEQFFTSDTSDEDSSTEDTDDSFDDDTVEDTVEETDMEETEETDDVAVAS